MVTKITTVEESKSYKYAHDVIDGKILASKFIIKQAKRFLADLERDDLYFDVRWANVVNVFFGAILYIPELGEAKDLPPPHAFYLEQVHCMRWKDTGLKKYKMLYAQMARKQAKTYIAAGNALLEMLYGNDKNASILCGANSRDQAIFCTEMVGKLIAASPELKAKYKAKEITTRKFDQKCIGATFRDEDTNRWSRLEAMSRDVKDGSNPSILIVDELHEAKNLALLENGTSGQGLRQEPFTMIITSAGFDKDAPCYSVLRNKAVKILDGTVEDDTFLPILFELDHEDEWDDINMLEKSNPMIPYFPTLIPFIKGRIKEAKIQGGFIESSVKIKTCGVWVDAAEVWIQRSVLEQNEHNIKDEELIGRECYTGLDLAKSNDLNAFAMFFPNVRPNIHVMKTIFWIPEYKVNNHRDGVDYKRWVQQGHMIQQQGNVADHMAIARDIIEMVKPYELKSFGYDAKYAIMAVLPMMAEAGYEEQLSPVGQGWTISPAVVQIFNWTAKKQMQFGNHPTVLWNYANTVMRMGDQGDQIPSKVQSGNKIDAVSAHLTAVTEYLRHNAEYETKGIIEIW